MNDSASSMIGDNSKMRPLMEALSEDHAQLRHDLECLAGDANSAPKKIRTPEDLEAIGKIVISTRNLAKKIETARTSAKEPFLQSGRDVDTFFANAFGQATKKPFTGRIGRLMDVFQKIGDDYAAEQEAKRRAEAKAAAEKARREEDERLELARKAEEAGRSKTATNHEAKAEIAAARAHEAEAQASASAADLVRTQTNSGMTMSAKAPWDCEIVDYDVIDLNKLRAYFKRDDVERALRFAVRQGVREITGVRVFQTTKASFQMKIHVVDCETTGLDPEKDRVVEIGAVEVISSSHDPWTVHGAPRSSYVNPQCSIPPEASGIHHIVDEDVVGAPWLGDAIKVVLSPVWETSVDIVAAHNAKFDKPFLPPLKDKRWICTWRCAMHVWPDAPSFKNGALFYWLGFKRGVDAPAPHRAGFDAWMTAHILCRLLSERGVDELLKLSRKAVVLKKVGFGKHFGQLWTEVPDSYLRWASGAENLNPDVKFTVKTEIARRAQ